MTISITAAPKILRLKQVKERVGLGRSTIYSRLDINSPGYDASFPQPIRLSGVVQGYGVQRSGASGPIGWLEESINIWILTRPSALQAEEPAEVTPKRRSAVKGGRTFVGRCRSSRDATA